MVGRQVILESEEEVSEGFFGFEIKFAKAQGFSGLRREKRKKLLRCSSHALSENNVSLYI